MTSATPKKKLSSKTSRRGAPVSAHVHYCGCDSDAGCDCSEWCCGGDGPCEAWADEPDCADGLSHRWTCEGMGGCDSNPGVWSLGGTAIQEDARCLHCGCGRRTIWHGSQRNPGECDERRYETGEYEPDADAVRTARRNARRRYLRARRHPAWAQGGWSAVISARLARRTEIGRASALIREREVRQ